MHPDLPQDLPTAGHAPTEAEPITLNPDDPYERVLIEMVTLSRRKSADYAADNDRFSNFRISGSFAGGTALQSCRVLLGTKIARLMELLKPGKTPKNESIRDTMVDMAVYSAIAVALYDEENNT